MLNYDGRRVRTTAESALLRRCCMFLFFLFLLPPHLSSDLATRTASRGVCFRTFSYFFFFPKKKNIFSPNFLKKKTNGSDLLCRISCNGGWCVSIVCGKPALFLITMFLFCCLFDSTPLVFPLKLLYEKRFTIWGHHLYQRRDPPD